MRKRYADEALNELVEEKKVARKDYGASKVWLISQDRFPEVDTSLLDSLDDQINVRRTELNTLLDSNKANDKVLKELTVTQTNDQLADLLTKLTSDIESLETRLSAFKTGGIELISEDVL